MAEFAHEILLIELPFGVGMIVFALFCVAGNSMAAEKAKI